MSLIKPITLLLFSACLSACSTGPISSADAVDYVQQGKASFYANKFQGRQTASGERFNQTALTAAHKRLPFGSKVRVTNLANRKTTVVRINDRGPFVSGRIIDLSRSAFERIAHTGEGVIEVKIEVLDR